MHKFDSNTEELIENKISLSITYITGTNKKGDVLVAIKEEDAKPARLVSGLDRNELIKDEYIGREVLVVFPEGNTDIPVIIALMENPIDQLVSLEIEDDEKKQEKDFKIDGKQVTIEAENEIVMKCGKASILLRNDGKIIIKGTHLLSRSSGPNRIKGASVGIN